MVDFSYGKNRVKQINLTQLYLLLHNIVTLFYTIVIGRLLNKYRFQVLPFIVADGKRESYPPPSLC